MTKTLDDIAIDRPPAVSSPFTPFIEAFLILSNVLGFCCGLVLLGFTLVEVFKTTVPILAFLLFLLMGGFYFCWLWFPMVKTISYLRHWRRAANVYETTWVKERLREVEPIEYIGRLFGRLIISLFVWYIFFEYNDGWITDVWFFTLFGAWICWAVIEWRYLRKLCYLREFILTTQAPSSRSAFAPK